MKTELFLEPLEVKQLTNKSRRPSQVRVLHELGITHRVRSDGSIAILRAHVHKVFDGLDPGGSTLPPKTIAPNWDAI